ncbi:MULTISPECIES: hypothetical protein [unclassified Paenibacillus]|uniref:hypothetical protein n=1 Tax=unclassified Paenibacillus TaxID=185978 RepID=UPI0004F7A662|nr:hypothetical protein [Paenibacillus sp. FSL H7-0357]AIQ20680.1 hypothetical protein H70357_31340 [Paenibacillus sp. FSL H7-0357]
MGAWKEFKEGFNNAVQTSGKPKSIPKTSTNQTPINQSGEEQMKQETKGCFGCLGFIVVIILIGSIYFAVTDDNEPKQASPLPAVNVIEIQNPTRSKPSTEPSPTIIPEITRNLSDIVWKEESYIQNLKQTVPLKNGIISDTKLRTNKFTKSESTTKIKNGLILELVVVSDTLNKSTLDQMAYNIFNKVHSQKTSVSLTSVFITFSLKRGNESSEWQNYILGINSINKYFKNNNTSPDGLFNWIEQNFKLPEGDFLEEDNSWTTLSRKASPK